jgi:hypothetical protein
MSENKSLNDDITSYPLMDRRSGGIGAMPMTRNFLPEVASNEEAAVKLDENANG